MWKFSIAYNTSALISYILSTASQERLIPHQHHTSKGSRNSSNTYLDSHTLPSCIPLEFMVLPTMTSVRRSPRRVPLTQDIKWPSCFCRCRKSPWPHQKIHHSLQRTLYFWRYCSLVSPKSNSLWSPLHILRSTHLLLIHQNVPIAVTHTTKPWFPSLWCSNSHLWVHPSYHLYYKGKPYHNQS